MYAPTAPSNMDGAVGALDEVKRIVAQLRARRPKVRIVVRGNSAFCREELMAWREADENQVNFLFGLARNCRLQKITGRQMHEAKLLHAETGKAARVAGDAFLLSVEASLRLGLRCTALLSVRVYSNRLFHFRRERDWRSYASNPSSAQALDRLKDNFSSRIYPPGRFHPAAHRKINPCEKWRLSLLS